MSYGTPPPPGYGNPPQGYPQLPPNHPQATTILVLGILGLVACGFLGIPAWVMGNRALREIDASGGALGGRGQVQAGRICGIVATVFLILIIVAVIAFLVLAVIVGGTTSSSVSAG